MWTNIAHRALSLRGDKPTSSKETDDHRRLSNVYRFVAVTQYVCCVISFVWHSTHRRINMAVVDDASPVWHILTTKLPSSNNRELANIASDLLATRCRPIIRQTCKSLINTGFDTLRPRQRGHRFPDDILKWIFMNENTRISINISLNFVPRYPIYNIPALVQIMVWRRPGDNRHLNQWRSVYWRIYASSGLNEIWFDYLIDINPISFTTTTKI